MVLEKKLPTRRRSPEALGTEVSSEASGTEVSLATWSVTNDRQPEASQTASKVSRTAFESLRTLSKSSRMAPRLSQLESESRERRLDCRKRHLNRRFNRRWRHERHLICVGFAQATSASSGDVDSCVAELRRRFRNVGEWDY